MTDGPLARLATLCGIQFRFSDARGQWHDTPADGLQAVLAAMGIAAGSESEIFAAIDAIEAADRDRLLPQALVTHPDGAPIPLPAKAEWRLELDDGRRIDGSGDIDPGGLPVGMHRLQVTAGEREGSATLLACPRMAPDCRSLTGREKLWGIAAPLYGLSSGRNLGLGTYADLAELAEVTAPMGADYLAINPVHALFPTQPSAFSPYSPSHRRFLNTAHIDPQAVPDFSASAAAQTWLSEHAGAIDRLRGADLVDYPAAMALLQPVLEMLFDAFEAGAPPDAPRARAFAGWCAAAGPELDRFATHQALSERFGPVWSGWPAELRDPAGPEVESFASRNRRRLRFYKYLQWVSHTQLDAAQARARAAGMGLGLVSDLAVGVRPDGAEAWAEPQHFARGVSLGAPPDAFNPGGQNWHLAPFNPLALRRDGYRAFAATLGASMRWCGAIRIDHIVGFRRSYWIPDGQSIGAYVEFPVEDLLAVAAIEGHRQQCLVIGEDLGNVPPGLRDRMEAAGIHGCRLTYFERDWSTGAFTPPDRYTRLSAAAIGSHDLPGLRDWWDGSDISRRRSLGIIDDHEVERETWERAASRDALLAALRAAGFLPGEPEPGGAPEGEALFLAIHRFLAATASSLATVQAENLFAMPGQLNMPGTIDTHPNWRRRLPPAAAWRDTPRVRAIAGAMSALRPRGG